MTPQGMINILVMYNRVKNLGLLQKPTLYKIDYINLSLAGKQLGSNQTEIAGLIYHEVFKEEICAVKLSKTKLTLNSEFLRKLNYESWKCPTIISERLNWPTIISKNLEMCVNESI